MRIVSKLFLDHPATVEEGYFEHMVFAGRFSMMLMGAAVAALIHAIVPCLFEKTAGNLIREMHHKMENR